MAKKLINASNNQNKASKKWQQKNKFHGVKQNSHHEIYQEINSVTQALNKQKKQVFSYPNEGHKGQKI